MRLINKASQSDLSNDEKEFLNVCDSLEYIDRYLTKDKKEWLRKKASEKLAKVEKEISDVEFNDTNGNPLILWDALTGEVNENMQLLKQNFNERLLPTITRGYEEDLKKAYLIIEQFGKFLLNPTNSELIDLNKSMSQLKILKTEHFSLIHFFDRYPKMYLPQL